MRTADTDSSAAELKSPDRLPSLRWAVGGTMLIMISAKVLGVGREVIKASLFGTSQELDVVLLGHIFPLVLCVGIGGGISRAVVPLGAALARGRLGGLYRLATWRLFLIVVPVFAVVLGTSPVWATFLVPADSLLPVGGVRKAAALASLALVGGSLAGLSVGIANAAGRHVTATSTQLCYNLVVITGMVALAKPFGAWSLLLAIVMAEWLQILPILPFMSKIWLAAERIAGDTWSRLRELFWPSVFLGMGPALMVLVDRVFAARMETGTVSALNYAEILLNQPVTLIGMALGLPLYTRLSRYAAQKRLQSYEETLELGIRYFILAGVPCGVLMTGLSIPIVGVLFERYEFQSSDTARVGIALRGYAVAFVFQAMIPLLQSAGLAIGRGWRVVGINLVMVGINAAANAVLIGPFGLLGITIATSIVATLFSFFLLVNAAPRLGWRGTLWKALGRGAVLAVAGGAALWLFNELAMRVFQGYPQGFFGRVLWLAGGTAFAGLAFLLAGGKVLLSEWRSLNVLRDRAANDANRP